MGACAARPAARQPAPDPRKAQPDLKESHHDAGWARSPGFKCQKTRVSCTEAEEQCSAMQSELEDEEEAVKKNMMKEEHDVHDDDDDDDDGTTHAIVIVERGRDRE